MSQPEKTVDELRAMLQREADRGNARAKRALLAFDDDPTPGKTSALTRAQLQRIHQLKPEQHRALRAGSPELLRFVTHGDAAALAEWQRRQDELDRQCGTGAYAQNAPRVVEHDGAVTRLGVPVRKP